MDSIGNDLKKTRIMVTTTKINTNKKNMWESEQH